MGDIGTTNASDVGVVHLLQAPTDALIVEQLSRKDGRVNMWNKLTSLWLNVEEW